MDYFPEYLSVRNVEDFPRIYNEHILSEARMCIKNILLSRKTENVFFSYLSFFYERKVHQKEHIEKLLGIIVKELEQLGWTTSCSCGSLFIYANKDNPPNNYFAEVL